MDRKRLIIGVDTGGTFTDAAALEEKGGISREREVGLVQNSGA